MFVHQTYTSAMHHCNRAILLYQKCLPSLCLEDNDAVVREGVRERKRGIKGERERKRRGQENEQYRGEGCILGEALDSREKRNQCPILSPGRVRPHPRYKRERRVEKEEIGAGRIPLLQRRPHYI